jgi:uncharacterized RDD family membrane protein YckC
MEEQIPQDGQDSGTHQESPGPEHAASAEIPAAKADITKRIVAAVIDGVLGVVVSMIPLIGGIVATAYWLVRDGLELEFMDRRSLGKKLMKLRPVRLDGSPMDIATSVRRNWPFAIGGVTLVLTFIPIIGWLLMVPVAFAGLIVGVIETYLCFTDAEGRRMGDKFAETKVIEVE